MDANSPEGQLTKRLVSAASKAVHDQLLIESDEQPLIRRDGAGCVSFETHVGCPHVGKAIRFEVLMKVAYP